MAKKRKCHVESMCQLPLSVIVASHPGGVALLLAASCYRNWSKASLGRFGLKRLYFKIDSSLYFTVNRENTILNITSLFSGKNDKSHRVKTYMLVTAYQGFRVCDFSLFFNFNNYNL